VSEWLNLVRATQWLKARAWRFRPNNLFNGAAVDGKVRQRAGMFVANRLAF
jgi:hypothetical protein